MDNPAQIYIERLLSVHQAEDAFEPQFDDAPAIDEDGC